MVPVFLSLAAAGAAVSCAPETAAAPRSLVVITLDTTRRDRMGFHGYRPSLTPHLDELAGRSVVFEDAYSVCPLTLPAHASLFTGLYPASHGVRENALFRLPPEARTLAEILKDRGYATGAAVAAFVLERDFGIDQGFDRYRTPPRVPGTSGEFMAELPASVMVDLALQDLKELAPPFFYWLHLFDPHFPYAPGDPGKVSDDPRQYDAEIRLADEQLGRLLEFLESQPWSEELVVVFAADHGESLGDAPEATHGYFLYDATMRIPLLLCAPGLPPRRCTIPVSLVDVLPTVLAILALDGSLPPVDGVNLLPVLAGEALPERCLGMESYNLYYNLGFAPSEGVVNADWKFVHSHRDLLFDRDEVPAESTNHFAPDHHALPPLRAAHERLFEHPAHRLSAEELVLSEDDRNRLASLGYLDGSAAPPLHGRPDFAVLPDGLAAGEVLVLQDDVNTHLMKGEPAAAVEKLRLLCRLAPRSALFEERLGSVLLSLGPQFLDEAEQHLLRAVELNFPRAKAHYNLGLCASRRLAALEEGDEERAVLGARALAEYRLALRFEPGHPESLANVATLLRTESERRRTAEPEESAALLDEAIGYLDRFLEVVSPRHPDWPRMEAARHRWAAERAALR